MKFNASLPMTQALKDAFAEKALVELHLRNGATLAGNIGGLGPNNVVLTHLSGKEFYDALIRIDDIMAIETRIRS